MSSLEDFQSLSRRELQKLASKNGVKANMKSDQIIAQLIKEGVIDRLLEEKKDDGEKDGVKWFPNPNKDNNFEIGVELYKGRFPLVKGDDRTYMKVHMRGMPIKFKGATGGGDACQLFYLSSGKNSNLGGVWLPTNVISFKMRKDGGKRVWRWWVHKKPWSTDVGTSNASTRFGGDPSVAMISLILGCLRKEDDCAIEKIKAYVNKTLKRHLEKVFGEEIAEEEMKEMEDYYRNKSEEINKYLRDKWENTERPECDDYDINIWIKKCNSYNWFAPFDSDNPDYIPILDPLDENSLWEEVGKGNNGLILQSGWLDNPTATMKYVKLKNDILVEKDKGRLKMKETGLKILKTRRTHLHFGTIGEELASREKLLTRQKEVTPTKYSPVQSSSRQSSYRQSSSSFSPEAELKKQRALEYKYKDLHGSFPLSTQSCEKCKKEVGIHQRVRMTAAKMGHKGGGFKGERPQYMKNMCIDCAIQSL